MPIDAGERDRLVTVEQVTDTDTDSGFPIETWTTLYTGYFQKVDARGRERFEASQMTAAYDTRWRGGYRADMDPELIDVAKTRRLVYQGRVYNVTSGVLIGRRDGVELLTLSGGD